jgi:hypothetical protein
MDDCQETPKLAYSAVFPTGNTPRCIITAMMDVGMMGSMNSMMGWMMG